MLLYVKFNQFKTIQTQITSKSIQKKTSQIELKKQHKIQFCKTIKWKCLFLHKNCLTVANWIKPDQWMNKWLRFFFVCAAIFCEWNFFPTGFLLQQLHFNVKLWQKQKVNKSKVGFVEEKRADWNLKYSMKIGNNNRVKKIIFKIGKKWKLKHRK